MNLDKPSILLCAAFLAAFVSSEARANVAASTISPGGVTSPLAQEKTPLVVEDEQLSFRCVERDDVPTCLFEARYRIVNPTPQLQRVVAAFYGTHTENVTVTVDGVRSSVQLTHDNIEKLDHELKKAQSTLEGSPLQMTPESDLSRWGLDLSAPPGTRHDVVVTGTILPGKDFHPGGYGLSAVNARHPAVSRRLKSQMFRLTYLISPLWTWSGSPSIHVSIRYPDDWVMELPSTATWSKRPTGDDQTEASTTLRAAQEDQLEMIIVFPEPTFNTGGPLVAIGGTTGKYGGFRARMGWEVSAPDWLLYSLTFDTNADDRAIVTPLIEAATPAVLVIPSLGAGIGAPIQVAPDTRVGLRLQGDIHFYPLGFVTSVDIYPKAGHTLPAFTEVSLLGQIGF